MDRHDLRRAGAPAAAAGAASAPRRSARRSAVSTGGQPSRCHARFSSRTGTRRSTAAAPASSAARARADPSRSSRTRSARAAGRRPARRAASSAATSWHGVFADTGPLRGAPDDSRSGRARGQYPRGAAALGAGCCERRARYRGACVSRSKQVSCCDTSAVFARRAAAHRGAFGDENRGRRNRIRRAGRRRLSGRERQRRRLRRQGRAKIAHARGRPDADLRAGARGAGPAQPRRGTAELHDRPAGGGPRVRRLSSSPSARRRARTARPTCSTSWRVARDVGARDERLHGRRRQEHRAGRHRGEGARRRSPPKRRSRSASSATPSS